jgi:hypothetical protein
MFSWAAMGEPAAEKLFAPAFCRRLKADSGRGNKRLIGTTEVVP